MNNRHLCLSGPLALLLAAPVFSQVIVREHVGEERWSTLGSSVDFIGDLDGDGIGDYAVNGRDAELGPGAPFLAVRSGATGAVLRTYGVLAQPGPLLRVTGVGDVNGDGLPDLGVAGTNGFSVLSGAADERLWTTLQSFLVSGYGVAGVGDVNQDGVPDVAYVHIGNTFNEGATAVHSGVDGSLIWSIPLDGTAVARIGDANGDGVDDLVVGDRSYTATGVAAGMGRALVLDAVTGALIRIHRVDPIANGQAYGASVCRLGDLDGDGIDDFAVAAPATTRSSNYPAWIDLWSSASGDRIRRISRIGENGLGGGLAGSLAGAGDLDGDGFDDLVAGFEAVIAYRTLTMFVRAFSSQNGRTIGVYPAVGGPGASIAVGDDVDGDGFKELLVGAPFEGGGTFDQDMRGRVTVFSLRPLEDAVARFCPAAPNSTGQAGRIDIAGSTELAVDDFTLVASQVPPGTFGLFVAEDLSFPSNNPLGNGDLCMVSPRRLPVILPTGTGAVSLPLDQDWLASAPWRPLSAGDAWSFQFWSRDNVGAGSNLTDGLFVEFR